MFILFNHAWDLCPATAPHTSAIYRYAQMDRNRYNSLLSRQNRIKPNNYTQNTNWSLLGLTDRNRVDAGRWTLISPRQAKEGCTQSYSVSELLTSICSICLLQTRMSKTQKLTYEVSKFFVKLLLMESYLTSPFFPIPF